MDTELRPLSLGEILDRTFQIYRSRFALFAGIAVVAATIRLVFAGLLVILLRTLATGHQNAALQIATALGSLVTEGIALFAAGLTFAALTFAVTQLYLDRPTSITDAYRGVRLHLLRYVGLNLLSILLGFAPFVLLGVLFGAGMVAAALGGGAKNSTAIAAAFVGFVGLYILLGIPACLWMVSRYALGNAAAISESLTIRAALKRSVHLSVGTRGRIVLALVCVAVVQLCFGLLLMSPFFQVMARSAAHPPLWLTLSQLSIGFVSSVLFTPIYGIVLTLFYYDARIRKEGFDVEWLLERTDRTESTGRLDSTTLGVLPG